MPQIQGLPALSASQARVMPSRLHRVGPSSSRGPAAASSAQKKVRVQKTSTLEQNKIVSSATQTHFVS